MVDFSTLVRVSRTFHIAIQRRMYRDVCLVTIKAGENQQQDSKRRRLLLRTLRENPNVASTVRRVSTLLTPESEVSEFLATLPGLRSLRWHVKDVSVVFQDGISYVGTPLPAIPATVINFDVLHQVPAMFLPSSLNKVLKTANQLCSLALASAAPTATAVLQLIGARLDYLKLWMWDQHSGRYAFDQMNACLSLVANVTRLRLYTILPSQIEAALFPQGLQQLSLDRAPFKTVDKIVRLLSGKPTWCPSLVRLPAFKVIAYIDYLSTRFGRADWRAFKNVCRLATLNIRKRPAWKGRIDEVDHLLRRIRARAEGPSPSLPWNETGR